MSDQNSSTKWSIIPGSEYEFKGERSDGAVGVVKAVAGDVVFWSHKWRNHRMPSEVGKEFGAREWSIDSFRANFRPEDQSPIPSLLAALKAYRDLDNHRDTCEECSENLELAPECCSLCMPFADRARLLMRAALALAGESSGEESSHE